jgi:hypothetical protein
MGRAHIGPSRVRYGCALTGVSEWRRRLPKFAAPSWLFRFRPFPNVPIGPPKYRSRQPSIRTLSWAIGPGARWDPKPSERCPSWRRTRGSEGPIAVTPTGRSLVASRSIGSVRLLG